MMKGSHHRQQHCKGGGMNPRMTLMSEVLTLHSSVWSEFESTLASYYYLVLNDIVISVSLLKHHVVYGVMSFFLE